MGIADGPTEVHKVTLARQVLKRLPAASTGCSRAGTSRPGATQARRQLADVLELDGRASV